MAIIKAGVLVTGISGTIGGVLFSRGKSGAYAAQAYRIPRQQTQKQSVYRGKFQEWAVTWATLTPTQRADWDVFAALPSNERTNPLGETYFFSGYNAFVQINQQRVTTAQNLRLTAPGTPFPLALSIVSFSFLTVGTADLVFLTGDTPSNFVVVFAAVFRSQGLLNASFNFQLVHASASSPTSPINLFTDIEDVFGDVRTDSKVFLKTWIQKGQGHRGPVSTINADVVT